MKYPRWCNIIISIKVFSITNIHFAKKIIRQQPVSTLDSGHHQDMINVCLHMQKLKTLSWRYSFYKHIKNVCKVYKGKINYKKAQRHNKDYLVFENCYKEYQFQ